MNTKLKIGVFISARMGSKRLPGKNLMPFDHRPLFAYCIDRLKYNNNYIPLYLTTTTKKEDDVLKTWADDLGIPTFRGSENNLIERNLNAAYEFDVDFIVRATSDCPFIGSELLFQCLDQISSINGFDKLSTTKNNYPMGLDLEFFPRALLEKMSKASDLNDSHREHLTLYAYEKLPETIARLKPTETLSNLLPFLFTLDTIEDYQRMQKLANQVSRFASYDEIFKQITNS